MAKRTIKVDEREINALLKTLEGVTGAAVRASRRATTKTLRTLKSRLTKALAAESQVPQKALKGRMFLRQPKPLKTDGGLWIGVRDLPAHRVGKPRQTRQGVTVGKHKFPSAFIWRGLVMARTTRERLPIELQRVQVKYAIVPNTVDNIAPRYLEVLAQEVNYEILKAAGKA